QKALQGTARRFAAENLPALAAEVEKTGQPVPAEWLRRYGELGALGVNTRTVHGGMGLDLLDALLVLEEFAKISVGVAFPVFECCTGPVRIVEALARPALAQRIVGQSAAGGMLVAIAMS